LLKFDGVDGFAACVCGFVSGRFQETNCSISCESQDESDDSDSDDSDSDGSDSLSEDSFDLPKKVVAKYKVRFPNEKSDGCLVGRLEKWPL
jgi:hypothetical protein